MDGGKQHNGRGREGRGKGQETGMSGAGVVLHPPNTR